MEVGDIQVRVGHLSSTNRFTGWNTSGLQIDAVLAVALTVKNTSSFYHSLEKNKCLKGSQILIFFFYKMFYDIIKEDAFWKNMEP